jgi:hypothetical protein
MCLNVQLVKAPAGTSHSNGAAVDVSGGGGGSFGVVASGEVAPTTPAGYTGGSALTFLGQQSGGRVGGTGTQITASEPNESK